MMTPNRRARRKRNATDTVMRMELLQVVDVPWPVLSCGEVSVLVGGMAVVMPSGGVAVVIPDGSVAVVVPFSLVLPGWEVTSGGGVVVMM